MGDGQECQNCRRSQRNCECKPTIYHRNMDEIVCPYCGYDHKDSWEFFGGRDRECVDMECLNPDCEKKFTAIQNVKITYSTKKIENNIVISGETQ